MDLTRDEENEYASIDYSSLTVDRESTNLTSRMSSEGNTYEEPNSAVNKREQKMFEPRVVLPLIKKKKGKKQNSQEYICSIKCRLLILLILLILFILLTSALSLLFCLHYLEVMKLPDKGVNAREVDENIRKLKSNASDLSHEIKRLRDEISEKDGRHAADITKLKDNSTALQRTIDNQEKKMELQAADIDKLTNNASILMGTISSQKKTISEKEELIVSRDFDINQLINKLNELAPEHTSVLLLGGWHGDITHSTTIYNSTKKSWKNCKLTLPSILRNHGAAIINNEIYIFGGDGNEILNSLYKLGAGNNWERMADMNEKRMLISQSSVVFNSEIWVIGGWDGRNALKSVEKYNPKTKKWTQMPELNELRGYAAATVVNGKIYVFDSQRPRDSVKVYDPKKGKWEIFNSSMPYGAYSHILIGNNSHLIVIGGDSSHKESTNRVWKMNVSDPQMEWEEMPYLRQGRYHSGAVIIADGLMVFGGITNTQTTDSVEIFDGVEWKNGAPLPEKRSHFASIPLTWAQERLFLQRYCQNS